MIIICHWHCGRNEMDLGLTDRVALVTGASGGIGGAVSRSLASEGARVGVAFHHREDLAQDLVSEIAAVGGAALAVQHDMSDQASTGAVFDTLISKWGRIDILVS